MTFKTSLICIALFTVGALAEIYSNGQVGYWWYVAPTVVSGIVIILRNRSCLAKNAQEKSLASAPNVVTVAHTIAPDAQTIEVTSPKIKGSEEETTSNSTTASTADKSKVVSP